MNCRIETGGVSERGQHRTHVAAAAPVRRSLLTCEALAKQVGGGGRPWKTVAFRRETSLLPRAGARGYGYLNTLLVAAVWASAAGCGPRRAGDPPVLIASYDRATELLGWEPQRGSLHEMISSAWTLLESGGAS